MAADALAHAQALLAARSVPKALAAFHSAEGAGADPDTCAAGRWECLMLLGDYEAAWKTSDAIDAHHKGRHDAFDGHSAGPQRFWTGESLRGKQVMLRCLHGFGDALQFIRFAPQICAAAASLCVEANPEIVPLLRACRGVEQVIPWGPLAPAQPPAWDAQIEIMELPRIVRATIADLPVPPYLDGASLHTEDETIRRLKVRSQTQTARPRIGFSWRSSNWNPLRSVPFPTLARSLAAVRNCHWYSLQQEGQPELEAFPHAQNIEAADLAILAMRIAQLDAILTVDGVLAHLAGALGLPVLLLLPHAADWRWGLADTTPWYPRMRLFRQQTPGDWSHPVAAAVKHLTSL